MIAYCVKDIFANNVSNMILKMISKSRPIGYVHFAKVDVHVLDASEMI